MDLRNEVVALLGREENAGNPLAAYLAACLNAFNADSWRNALAIRAEWFRRYCNR